MMFEFEKIELIDGRWEKEIDQIGFWLNVDYNRCESNLLCKQTSDNDETMTRWFLVHELGPWIRST